MLVKRLLFISLIFISASCNNKQDVKDGSQKPEVKDEMVERMKQGQFKDSLELYQQYITDNYQVFAMPLPKNLDLCGDIVPLDKLNVRDQLDREILVNTYWHSNTFLYQKRAARWFPRIEAILAENGVPDDIKYIALIESGLTNVVSPAGATGFWQFMKGTGEGYGLEINKYVDERYDLEKSTVAACEYMKKAYKMFGNWSLAAASYNMGKGGLKNALEKQQVNSYFDLHLNNETSRYVYRILAAKLILSNSENFGFNFRPEELYEPYSTYTISVDTTITNLPQFALDQGANYQLLRLLNPWIRNYSIPNKEGKTYIIKLPKGDFNDLPKSSDTTKQILEEVTDTSNA